MKPALLKTISVALVTGMMLVSCGGGSGGNNLVANSGGIGGTGVVYGPITAFGSIFVNDLEIDISGAGITSDGNDADESALKLGMVVKVEGSFDSNNLTGTATAVTYKDNLEGPISDIPVSDATTRELVVLGQTVIISSSTTNFQNTTFADLVVGNVIEVSGLVDSTGAIVASHVEKKSESFSNGSAVIEVKGRIQNLDTNTGTFEINNLVVDYFSASPVLPQSGIANSQYVEVKGMSFGGSGELIATSIELEDEGIGSEAGHDGDYVELKGFVTNVISLDQFMMGNQLIEVNSSTRYEGGSSSTIQVGARLEVEGTISNGILIAQKIGIEGSENNSSEGDS